jgi:hypothetical protein
MGTDSKPTRIVFDYRGKFYKFMSFFRDKRNNSFYFHVYRKKGETLKHYNVITTEDGQMKLDFTSFQQTPFEENHLSFHESGVIHSKDCEGKRYQNGFSGIPFQDINTFLNILVIAPQNPKYLIETKSIDTRRDIQFHLKDDVEPFSIQFFIVRKDSNEYPHIPSTENLINGLVKIAYTGKIYDLIIGVTKVLKASPEIEVAWPLFPVVLKRIG